MTLLGDGPKEDVQVTVTKEWTTRAREILALRLQQLANRELEQGKGALDWDWGAVDE